MGQDDNVDDRDQHAAVPARRLTPGKALLMLWALVVYGSWIAVPFAAAGTFHWIEGWLYLGIVVVGQVCHRLYVARRNRELLHRRQDIGAGTLRWDFYWNLLFWPLMSLVSIVAGLDARHLWSPLPVWCWPFGLLVLISGFIVSAWAMGCNRHFEGTIRIQSEIGHSVVDSGPYRSIRHPGYLGLILWALAGPLIYLSGWALVPALVVVGWLVLRTALEDRFLQRELTGYADFAQRTRYRLLPGVW